MVHAWEEPFLAGEGGSGAVFFAGCPLRCVFCQNAPISQADVGEDRTPDEAADLLLDLQRQGAENIDLVSPTHFAPGVVAAVAAARRRGLALPVVWNSSGYESPETLRSLSETVDVFLPDLKHFDPQVSQDLCGAADYFARASEAVLEMARIAGPPVRAGGRLLRGLAVRHLVLPGLVAETQAILGWMHRNLPAGTPLSLMRQFTPMHLAAQGIPGYPALSRRLTTHEYRKAVDAAVAFGSTDLWVQEKGCATDRYTPDFSASPAARPPAG
jgi:putative pyruvate formate lyase activating enzyme